MAIGYYKPHTTEEYVNLEHASIAYEALRKIMSKEFHEPFVWRD
jgi:di/tripeptidase